MEPDKNLQKQIGIILSVMIMAVVFGVIVFANRNQTTMPVTDQSSGDDTDIATQNPAVSNPPIPQNTPTPPSATKKTTKTPPIDVPKKVTSVYRDGNYSATGDYMSPGGEDQITVRLTLKNDIITAVSVIPEAQDGTSVRYQNEFVSGYKAYVVGKNIADVNLGKVSGSSLTPIGFDNALAQIKAQARA